MKRGTIDHPKTCALAQSLGLPRYAAVGLLESLWHFTAQYAPRGDIGRWDDAAICHAVAWDREPAVLIGALISTHWFDTDENPTVRLVVHDWAEHADRGVHNRLQARKERFIFGGSNPSRTRVRPRSNRGSSGSGTGSGTGSGSSSPVSPESETEDPTKDPVLARFDRWYAPFPKHEDRAGALTEFRKLNPDDALLAVMLQALDWQRMLPEWTKENGQFVPQPRKYLKHKRWKDEAPKPTLALCTPKTAGNLAAAHAFMESFKR